MRWKRGSYDPLLSAALGTIIGSLIGIVFAVPFYLYHAYMD